MGNFYVNFSVQTKQQLLVVEALKQAKRVAIVTPPQDEYVVVYDEEADSQDTSVIQQLGTLLSKIGPTLAILNHDDDILCYWLYENGKEVDTYNSCPDYFGEEDDEQGGDSNKLCSVLKAKANPDDVEKVLRSEQTFAFELHQELVQLVGLPGCSVGFGYQYVANGELENEHEVGPLIKIS